MARRLILDTGVVIAAERGTIDINQVVHETDNTAIAAVTASELFAGLERADDAHRGVRQAFIDDVLSSLPVLDFTLNIARYHGRLLAHAQRAGRRRGYHDMIIAATAAATDRTVISLDAAMHWDELPGVRAVIVTPS